MLKSIISLYINVDFVYFIFINGYFVYEECNTIRFMAIIVYLLLFLVLNTDNMLVKKTFEDRSSSPTKRYV